MVNKNGVNKVTTNELKVREKESGKEGRRKEEESRWGRGKKGGRKEQRTWGRKDGQRAVTVHSNTEFFTISKHKSLIPVHITSFVLVWL